VEHRQNDIQGVVVRDLEVASGEDAPPVELGMAALHPFRRASGAGRVEDGERVAGLRGIRLDGVTSCGHWLDRASVEVARHRLVKGPHSLEPLERRLDRAEMLELGRLGDEDERIGVSEHVMQLRPPARDVDGNERGPQPAACEERVEHLDPIAGRDEHPVARGDSGCSQDAGSAGDGVLHPCVGALTAGVPEQRLVAPARGAVGECTLHRPIFDRERLGEVAHRYVPAGGRSRRGFARAGPLHRPDSPSPPCRLSTNRRSAA
jgi:hypothetical protein